MLLQAANTGPFKPIDRGYNTGIGDYSLELAI